MALDANTTQYIKTLAQTFGLDEKALVAKAEADESARKALDIVPRSTFSSELDKVRAKTQEEFKPQFEQWKGEYYQKEVLPRWNQREQEVQTLTQQNSQLRAEQAAYKSLYGDLEGFKPSAAAGGSGQGNAPGSAVASPAASPQYMTREEAGQMSALMAKEMTRAGLQYMKETGNVLDVDKFEEHVIKGKYQGPDAIRRALDDFVKPERDARAAAELEARIKREREEAVKEWATQHAMPMDNAAPTQRGSALFRQPSKSEADEAALADPATPKFVKDEIQRKAFLQDLGPATLAGALTGR